MKNINIRTIITLGFALFAMFFGAGNLILPPFIGLETGDQWLYGIIGFGITGIIGPFLGLLAVIFSGESFFDLGKKIHPLFSVVMGTIIMLCIGPIIAIPRTSSLTYEIGIQPFFPYINSYVGSFVFFAVVIALSFSKSKIVDIIGNFLTPVLLLILFYLLYVGIINPVSTDYESLVSKSAAFGFGFVEGYQTLDVLASVIFAGIIIGATQTKGYHTIKERTRVSIFAGLLAIFFLLIIYGGLVYLGASSGVTNHSIFRTELLISIAHTLLGSSSTILLSICIALACLTTAIALTGAVASFFEQITRGFLPYKIGVLLCSFVAYMFSIMSVDEIIEFAVPILVFVYPIVLTLVLFVVLFSRTIKGKLPYIGAVIGTAMVAALGFLQHFNLLNEPLIALREYLPLYAYELEWLLPAIGFFVVFCLVEYMLKSRNISR
ncbi:LIV-II [Weeksella virosa]|uniref:branched-chain amino acid transport system II carrier protein n=1 Tax=Weeksella virosa TaxID=1014 RepID=UPI000DF96CCD|nr:branched-chain amino acid transport system II carrier protein [Weeksella virosa]SUP55094.1 LIV-II [Weeksella virosa]